MQPINLNPFHNLSNPLQQIIELNQKTLSQFSFIEHRELTPFHDPKALLEKNMQIFINNGHVSLNYMHQLFNILGHSWVNLSNDTSEKTKDMMKRTQSATASVINKKAYKTSKLTPTKDVPHSSIKKASGSTSSQPKHSTSKNEFPKRKSNASDKKEDMHKME